MRNKALFFFFLFVVALGLAIGSVLLGPLNHDEGWYLYAAQMVQDGQLPYVDFAYTQAPLLPFVYAGLNALTPAHGVLNGRVLTLALGLCSALFAAFAAKQLAPKGRRTEAAWLCLCLLLLNSYQLYFFSVVKTYSLTAFFLMGGFALLSVAEPKRSIPGLLVAGILFACAAGTRVSAVMALPATVLSLWLVRTDRRKGFYSACIFSVGALVALGVIFVPLALRAPDGFMFGLLEYHSGREVDGLIALLTFKVGFLVRVAGAYLVAAVLAVALLFLPRKKTKKENQPVLVGGWVSLLAISGLHLLTKFPYDDYQVFVFPLLTVVVAVGVIRRTFDWKESARHTLFSVVLLGSIASAVSSPVIQGWMIRGRDRIWWLIKEEPDLVRLQRAAHQLQKQGARNELLTMDTYLAVEGGYKVPQGLELGPFSYFPEMKTARAETLHVLNRELMLKLLSECRCEYAAFSDYAFAISCPGVTMLSDAEHAELMAALEQRYAPTWELADFGQAHTLLRTYQLRSTFQDNP